MKVGPGTAFTTTSFSLYLTNRLSKLERYITPAKKDLLAAKRCSLLGPFMRKRSFVNTTPGSLSIPSHAAQLSIEGKSILTQIIRMPKHYNVTFYPIIKCPVSIRCNKTIKL